MKLQYLTVIIIALLSSGIANALEFDFTYKGQTLKYKILIFCNSFNNLSLKFVTCCKLENNYLVLKT